MGKSTGVKQPTSVELNEATSAGVTDEDIQLLAVLGEGYAANLSKYVDGLFLPERLTVDDVDVVRLLCRNKDWFTTAKW
jgi:hypothetical protein